MLDFLSEAVKMPFWNRESFVGLIIRFVLHLAAVFLIVRFLYFRTSSRKDYTFTYILVSIVVFMLCFVLESVRLELGMALGLFAVFGIIRYRTGEIPIREMTYLFTVIGLAVVNSLSNNNISMVELVFVNGSIIFSAYLVERVWALKHLLQKEVVYDKIELIVPEKYHELKADLQERLGFDIDKIEVKSVDFLKDTASLTIFYSKH